MVVFFYNVKLCTLVYTLSDQYNIILTTEIDPKNNQKFTNNTVNIL